MRLIASAEKPIPGALEIAPGTWRVDDDRAELDAEAISAGAIEVAGTDARDAIPPRWDLPEGRWLRGYRAVRTVWTGEPDQIMGEDGRLYPVGSTEELAQLERDGVVRRAGDAREIDIVG